MGMTAPDEDLQQQQQQQQGQSNGKVQTEADLAQTPYSPPLTRLTSKRPRARTSSPLTTMTVHAPASPTRKKTNILQGPAKRPTRSDTSKMSWLACFGRQGVGQGGVPDSCNIGKQHNK